VLSDKKETFVQNGLGSLQPNSFGLNCGERERYLGNGKEIIRKRMVGQNIDFKSMKRGN
jgi:hypothetical protein